jgi:UDP-N-acetyl-D-mannosaminuronate dehydrogenase
LRPGAWLCSGRRCRQASLVRLWPRFWQRRLALQGAGVQELRRLPQLVAGLSEACVTAVRDVSFAFANMAAKVMSGLGLDIPATMALANTGYPRNPIAMPGPGVGGSCLRKDTRMLAGVAEALAVDAELLDAARCLNDSMPQFVAEQVSSEAATNGLAPDRTRVLVCGMAFKGDPQTADMERESTGLRSRGCWSTGECQCASMTRSCRPRQ